MKVPQAVDACLEHHRANSEKNTAIPCRFVPGRFRKELARARVDKLTSEEIFSFLTAFTEGKMKMPLPIHGAYILSRQQSDFRNRVVGARSRHTYLPAFVI